MKRWKIVFAIWIVLWIHFLIRGMVKGEFDKFKRLAFAGMEEKKSYILGDRLYEFLKTCERKIPESATYNIKGDIDEHNKLRMVYYLYPRLRSNRPDYILEVETKKQEYFLRRIR